MNSKCGTGRNKLLKSVDISVCAARRACADHHPIQANHFKGGASESICVSIIIMPPLEGVLLSVGHTVALTFEAFVYTRGTLKVLDCG